MVLLVDYSKRRAVEEQPVPCSSSVGGGAGEGVAATSCDGGGGEACQSSKIKCRHPLLYNPRASAVMESRILAAQEMAESEQPDRTPIPLASASSIAMSTPSGGGLSGIPSGGSSSVPTSRGRQPSLAPNSLQVYAPSHARRGFGGGGRRSKSPRNKFKRCTTSELVKEHRNRRPTTLNEMSFTDAMDMSESAFTIGGSGGMDHSMASMASIQEQQQQHEQQESLEQTQLQHRRRERELERERFAKAREVSPNNIRRYQRPSQIDWSQPSKRTVAAGEEDLTDISASQTTDALFPAPVSGGLRRSVSDSMAQGSKSGGMDASLSIQEIANEAKKSMSTSAHGHNHQQRRRRGHSFDGTDDDRLSFRIRRRTHSTNTRKTKSMDESISSAQKLELSLSNLSTCSAPVVRNSNATATANNPTTGGARVPGNGAGGGAFNNNSLTALDFSINNISFNNLNVSFHSTTTGRCVSHLGGPKRGRRRSSSLTASHRYNESTKQQEQQHQQQQQPLSSKPQQDRRKLNKSLSLSQVKQSNTFSSSSRSLGAKQHMSKLLQQQQQQEEQQSLEKREKVEVNTKHPGQQQNRRRKQLNKSLSMSTRTTATGTATSRGGKKPLPRRSLSTSHVKQQQQQQEQEEHPFAISSIRKSGFEHFRPSVKHDELGGSDQNNNNNNNNNLYSLNRKSHNNNAAAGKKKASKRSASEPTQSDGKHHPAFKRTGTDVTTKSRRKSRSPMRSSNNSPPTSLQILSMNPETLFLLQAGGPDNQNNNNDDDDIPLKITIDLNSSFASLKSSASDAASKSSKKNKKKKNRGGEELPSLLKGVEDGDDDDEDGDDNDDDKMDENDLQKPPPLSTIIAKPRPFSQRTPSTEELGYASEDTTGGSSSGLVPSSLYDRKQQQLVSTQALPGFASDGDSIASDDCSLLTNSECDSVISESSVDTNRSSYVSRQKNKKNSLPRRSLSLQNDAPSLQLSPYQRRATTKQLPRRSCSLSHQQSVGGGLYGAMLMGGRGAGGGGLGGHHHSPYHHAQRRSTSMSHGSKNNGGEDIDASGASFMNDDESLRRGSDMSDCSQQSSGSALRFLTGSRIRRHDGSTSKLGRKNTPRTLLG